MKRKLLSLLVSFLYLTASNASAQQGEWTWMKGSNSSVLTGTYGTQGVAAPANTPQGLYESGEWRDKQGNFWLYGGLNSSADYSNLWKYEPATNEWTWMKGPGNVANESAVYGTQGTANINNTPGARARGMATWVDTAGNFWLFGGDDAFSSVKTDLWKYDVGTNEWTWMSGSNLDNSPGIYGTLGVPSSTNHPGARRETNAAWTDADNNLWLFGGYGYDYIGFFGMMNDLWKYSIANNDWTWVRGSKSNGNSGSYGIQGVPDTSNNPPSRMVYTKWIDEDGNFWIFGGGSYLTNIYYNDAWKFDPAVNKWTWMSGSSTANNAGNTAGLCASGTDLVGPARFENRACWIDKCGSFWTFAGSINSSVDDNYNDLWNFNPQSLEWTQASGSVILNQTGSYGTQGVSSSSNVPPSRGGSVAWVDSDGNLWMWGGTQGFSVLYNDLWRYIIDPACPVQNSCSVLPQPGFFSNDTLICEKFCAGFVDSSQNSPTAWLWLFPGGVPSSSTDQNPANICYDEPGTYDVTLITTNAGGNDTLTLFNYITVYPTPPFPTITQVGYTLTSSPASSYQWQLNSVDIPGATNQSYTILQSGYYTVIISDSHGCKNSFTEYVLIDGIGDVMSDTEISIYPNPSSGNFTIELSNEMNTDEVSIEVLNILGQSIFYTSEKIFGVPRKKEIDLCRGARDCAVTGIYFVEIKMMNDPDFTGVRKKIILAR